MERSRPSMFIGKQKSRYFTTLFAVLQIVNYLLNIGELRFVDEVTLVDHLAGQASGIRLGIQSFQSDYPLAVLEGYSAVDGWLEMRK